MVKRALLLAFLVALTLAVSSPWTMYAQPQAPAAQEERVPAFNSAAPAKGTDLPQILGKGQLWGNNDQYPFQAHAYELAAKIPNVIYQQPCYCYCDRMGHNSLHSCYEGKHAVNCGACLKELYYSYNMHKKGQTARQIRQGIIAGDWKDIDLQSAASIN